MLGWNIPGQGKHLLVFRPRGANQGMFRERQPIYLVSDFTLLSLSCPLCKRDNNMYLLGFCEDENKSFRSRNQFFRRLERWLQGTSGREVWPWRWKWIMAWGQSTVRAGFLHRESFELGFQAEKMRPPWGRWLRLWSRRKSSPGGEKSSLPCQPRENEEMTGKFQSSVMTWHLLSLSRWVAVLVKNHVLSLKQINNIENSYCGEWDWKWIREEKNYVTQPDEVWGLVAKHRVMQAPKSWRSPEPGKQGAGK